MTHLCIDFGTSSTVAVLAGRQGVRPVLIDGLPSLPSGVCADPAGRLVTGPEAAHAAATAPERYEPYPKQRIDEKSVLLGGVEYAVADLIAAVLRRVVGQLPAPPQRVTLTHPAAWGAQRREVLWEAAARAGLNSVRLVSEPVAAAAHFTATAGDTLPAGGAALVCDVGAGTVDVSVVRRTPTGFEVLTTTGLADGGGLDLDAAIVAHLGTVYASRHGGAWSRLVAPSVPGDRAASRAFWTGVRTGKETLSRSPGTHIHLPIIEQEAPLGREQFEMLARPVLDRTVDAARAVLREARVEPSALFGVFLAGGGSRVPLLASMLHRALGVAPTAVESPELAVAAGAVTAEDVSGPDAELTVKAPRPMDRTKIYAAAQIPVGKPVKRSRRRRRRAVFLVVAALVVAAAGGAAAAAWPSGDEDGGKPDGDSVVTENGWNGEFFMQIDSASRDQATGRLLLRVRQASLGQNRQTIDGTGRWVNVRVDPDAEVWRADRSPSDVDELFADLGARADRKRGFTLTFNPRGEVTTVQWL
ncbi:actin-like ATPase involved in cell morphogenesis [Catenuloplanes nepalensis]|uniref:Actin-like ATPase involved in cell morphogenesis n=1 Tax=Catenuloplanes nepalensis TaxID=587533 RepID=A0ABT9MQI3_9ACTN|nr:Hsp70 family protein [Catenuloplanes nepalensis]MDP9793561.1 actin-like ATPase involved in cell morphogenesis [Catenuloplanes nepalensis]